LKADIGRVPLRVPKITEAACLGAAILASVAARIFPDLPAAADAAIAFNATVNSNPDAARAYERRYDLYKSLYNRLIPIHRGARESTLS
jgi:sugar (pentulose or hexulose) kinase